MDRVWQFGLEMRDQWPLPTSIAHFGAMLSFLLPCLAHLMQWTMWYDVVVITTCSTSYSYVNIFFSEATVTKWGNFDRSHQNLLLTTSYHMVHCIRWAKQEALEFTNCHNWNGIMDRVWQFGLEMRDQWQRGNVPHSLTCEWYSYISYNVL
jgi:hypothetical protein